MNDDENTDIPVSLTKLSRLCVCVVESETFFARSTGHSFVDSDSRK